MHIITFFYNSNRKHAAQRNLSAAQQRRMTALNSVLTRQDYEEIYRLLDAVSPVPFDCGTVCGAACCGSGTDSAPELGLYLLPGEESLHDRNDPDLLWQEDQAEDYDFPASWQGSVVFLRCSCAPHCPREKRPIQCRTFPLLPHLEADGILTLIWNDQILPYSCPLIEQNAELSPEFVRATKEAWRLLLHDPRIRDLVKMDSDARRAVSSLNDRTKKIPSKQE